MILSLSLVAFAVLVLTWRTAAKHGYREGQRDGYERGRRDADNWWCGVERAADQAAKAQDDDYCLHHHLKGLLSLGNLQSAVEEIQRSVQRRKEAAMATDWKVICPDGHEHTLEGAVYLKTGHKSLFVECLTCGAVVEFPWSRLMESERKDP